MEFSVKDNIKEWTASLDRLAQKQIPFATSTALNKTAVEAQESIQAAIPHIFNSRKKWWGKNQRTGIRVRFAKKDRLIAKVYTTAYFARIQEDGGIKAPKQGKHIAVPTDDTPRRMRKSNALRQADSRVFKAGSSIYMRKSKKKIVRLYSLTPQATIKKRFGFVVMAEKVVMRRFEKLFHNQLEYALRTAR